MLKEHPSEAKASGITPESVKHAESQVKVFRNVGKFSKGEPSSFEMIASDTLKKAKAAEGTNQCEAYKHFVKYVKMMMILKLSDPSLTKEMNITDGKIHDLHQSLYNIYNKIKK